VRDNNPTRPIATIQSVGHRIRAPLSVQNITEPPHKDRFAGLQQWIGASFGPSFMKPGFNDGFRSPAQTNSFLTNSPSTSVSLKSRPWNRYVNRV
jgi:hypothetical protein